MNGAGASYLGRVPFQRILPFQSQTISQVSTCTGLAGYGFCCCCCSGFSSASLLTVYSTAQSCQNQS